MGKLLKTYLNSNSIYKCKKCFSHLSDEAYLVSKAFTSGVSPAYLFSQCVNVTIGPSQDAILTTGLHTIANIYCIDCEEYVGWTYIKAFESSQQYKEDKFILITNKTILHKIEASLIQESNAEEFDNESDEESPEDNEETNGE